MTVDVVTAGEAMALFLAEPPYPLASADRFVRSFAGAEVNMSIGLARLGRSVRWVGRLGADPLGDAVLAGLRAEGVDVAHVVRDEAAPTGVLVRDAPQGRPVHVVYHREHSAGSRLCVEDVVGALEGGCRLVHLSGITPALSAAAADAAFMLAQQARDSGAEVVLDPNYRASLWPLAQARPALERLARVSDVVIVGEDEGALLTGAAESQAVADWYGERGASLVVVTRGAAGAWASDGRSTWEAPAHDVETLDVVGAGDAFDAGFLFGRLEGASIPRCLQLGNAAGALAAQCYGDYLGLPDLADLLAVADGAGDVRR